MYQKWKFNLSRESWWKGQSERMFGLLKDTLYKTVGRSKLEWKELEEMLTEIETMLNNWSLTYTEKDIRIPVLTPVFTGFRSDTGNS